MVNIYFQCRICGTRLGGKPLLKFHDMPISAQNLPDSSGIEHDRGADLTIYQCRSCGLLQLACEPVPYYRDVIRASAFSPEMCEFRKKQFKSFVKKYKLEHKRIIEIGCGRGEYLQILKSTGAIVYGLENNQESVKECLNIGLNVQQGFVDRSDFILQKAPFDGFIMLNFLEHLPAPVETLRGIANNLKEDAIGLLEVPNLEMIIKKNIFSEFISDHLLYFTKETLTQLILISGFHVIECKSTWHDYIISAVVLKRPKLNLTNLIYAQTKLKSCLHKFINRFPVGSVAVWGAGHQALAIIALTEIAPKIKYVIDSAPFKQGKFTPATHIPIVSPEILESSPPSAVIVMTASYTNEVVEKLLKLNFKKLVIAALNANDLNIIRDITD